MTDVLCLRGTTERPGLNGTPGGLLTEVTKHLDPWRFMCRDVAYPAAIGPANPEFNVRGGVSMQESIDAGVYALLTQVARAHKPVGLIGYSLGAAVISRYLEVLHENRSPQVNMIAFVGLVANPYRAEGDSIDGVAQGWGIAGQRKEWPTLPVFEVANPLDAITACPADSPLRYLADSLTFASAGDLGVWRNDVLNRLRTGTWQAGMRKPSMSSYARALTDLWAYLFGDAHIGAYTRGPRPLTRQLAELVNALPAGGKVAA